MEAVMMRAAHLVRRNWRATIFLALLAGLAGGIAMGAWAAGRRTATAFDRLIAYAELPDSMITFCPPEVSELEEASVAACLVYDARAELETIQRLPEVESAGRASFRGLTVAPAEAPGRTQMAGGFFSGDSSDSASGRPLVLEGRMYRTGPALDVVVNEPFQDHFDVAVGDELILGFWAADELGTAAADGERYHGPEARVRVVGVVRDVADIAAQSGSALTQLDEALVIGGPAVWEATPGAVGYGGIAVRARGGDPFAAHQAIQRTFPDRLFNISPANGLDEIDPIREAIGYEGRGVLAFAALAALAAAVFAGQAIARQARREWADLAALAALGLTTRQARAAAALRGLVIGGVAAVVAVATAIGLSAIGPVGVARLAEVDAGVQLDWIVLLAGFGLVLTVVSLAACLPVGRHRGRAARPTRDLVVPPTALRPPMSAGIGMALNGGRGGNGLPMGTALASVALAAGALLAAAVLASSLTALTSTPERYGAPWDASISDDVDEAGRTASFIRDSPQIEAAAAIRGADIEIVDQVLWAHALQPVFGVDETIRPVITAGREPVTADEIALGAITMRNLGVAIGDTVEARTTTSEATPSQLTVVGTALINDSYEGSAGLGAVVTGDWIAEFAPETTPDPYVIRFVPGTDPVAFTAELEEMFPGLVAGPVKQMAIRNVERIRYLPYVLVGLLAVLAVASLAHALVLSVRRHRCQLAVCTTLGFTRRQVAVAVASHASVLGVAAVVVGLPLGAVAGRWLWRTVADQLGVASGPLVPLAVVAAIAVGAVVVANLAAAVPAWQAARIETARALRVE